ncbi:MAG TPA: biotin/lipoyl-binding protein, partial [Cytophagaceae bacterium]
MHQYKSACLYIFVLVFHLPISSCTRSETKPVTAPQFCIEEELSSKIKIDTVSVQQIEKELILSGKITANEDKIVKVYPLVGGKVEDLKVELGDYVSKGQVLAEIR